MKTFQEIKSQSINLLILNYWNSVLTNALYILIIIVTGSLSYGIGLLFIAPPMLVAITYYSISIWRGNACYMEDFFKAGFNNYTTNIVGILWMDLFIFLWSLLLVVPGIIKAIAYSMTPYILADFPDVEPTDAISLSMRMTEGHMKRIFNFYLSFFGWIILSIITFGVAGILYAFPYMNLSFAGLYDELKNEALATGTIEPAELTFT